MTILRRLAILPAAAAFAALPLLVQLAAPSAARADCMPPPPIEDAVKSAEIVFVGTVAATSNRSSWASVTVEEVWRGPDQAAQVLVKGGPGGNAATSVDRSFEVGVKYLFFPYADAGGLADNSCTSTTRWTADLAALRPADARAPVGATSGGGGIDVGGLVAPLAVTLLVAGTLLVVGLAVRSRRSD